MTYLSPREAALKWGISPQAVRRYLRDDRIPGAIFENGMWQIPADQDKPGRLNSSSQPCEYTAPIAHKLFQQKKKDNYHGLYDYVQVYFTYCSCRLASNRLTMEQLDMLYKKGKIFISFEPLKISDCIEALNHFACIDYIIDHASDPLSQKSIKTIHSILTAGTIDERLQKVAPGKFRDSSYHPKTRTLPPADAISDTLDSLLKDYESFDHININDILSFHVEFEMLAPFRDYNGRVGRLIMFKECLRHGIMPFILTDKGRDAYISGIKKWIGRRKILQSVVSDAQEKFKSQIELQDLLQHSSKLK